MVFCCSFLLQFCLHIERTITISTTRHETHLRPPPVPPHPITNPNYLDDIFRVFIFLGLLVLLLLIVLALDGLVRVFTTSIMLYTSAPCPA